MIPEKEITNRLCYILIGVLIGLAIPYSKSTNKDIQVYEVTTDSIESKVIKPIPKKVLNEKNLRAELIKHNIPHVDIVIAQAKLESGNFKSDLVKTHQNIFGLRKKNSYRRYSHWTECVEDYSKRISSRYKGGDYYAFLKRINYTTDDKYIEKLKLMCKG